MKLRLRIDSNNQWFVFMWVIKDNKKVAVEFKIDTGCNALVLSRDTLEKLGISTAEQDLNTLPNLTGMLASGEKHIFKSLGAVSLCRVGKQPVKICNAKAICHATRETNDLLGTEVLSQFTNINFNLSETKYIELQKI